MMASFMRCLKLKSAGKVYPTGNPNFSVSQAFPSAFSTEEVDPFLMCDHFGPEISKGKKSDPDEFEVGWHPHRGMDIMTYLVEGVGRHADSMGNRGEYNTPGMQWISVGSGIEHAEGGGTPTGMSNMGFQIWINTPGKYKMDDPVYGVEPPENLPLWTSSQYPGTKGRLLAGEYDGLRGPFQTKQEVNMIDLMLEESKNCEYIIPSQLHTCVIYVYKGSGNISNTDVKQGNVLLMDGKTTGPRNIPFVSYENGLSVLIFSGKPIGEPIAWHGPFVMNTDEEIQRTIMEYRTGKFLRKRASWDYKRIATKPIHLDDKNDDKSNCL